MVFLGNRNGYTDRYSWMGWRGNLQDRQGQDRARSEGIVRVLKRYPHRGRAGVVLDGLSSALHSQSWMQEAGAQLTQPSTDSAEASARQRAEKALKWTTEQLEQE